MRHLFVKEQKLSTLPDVCNYSDDILYTGPLKDYILKHFNLSL